MPSKISALHRELYELPWDRRRFSAHRARVQSAGLLDCLLMFYHFQQMSTLWLTVWVWTFICLCFCDALLYCSGPRIDCGAPPSSDLSHLRQLLPSPSCDKTSFHFHANGVCCHLSQLLPSRCPLSTFFLQMEHYGSHPDELFSFSCKWSLLTFFSLLQEEHCFDLTLLASWSFSNQG